MEAVKKLVQKLVRRLRNHHLPVSTWKQCKLCAVS
jgi:hypothetical protein